MKELQEKIIKGLLSATKYIPSEHKMRLSASEVSSDMLELYLKRKHNISESKISQATIGSLLHVGCEMAFAEEDYVSVEETFSKLITGTNSYATATVDYIDTKNKVVIDWKTTKEYTAKMVKAAIKKGDLFGNGYILQMNHQNYIINEPGYKYYLGMFYKDAKVDYKTGIESDSFELIEIPMIDPDKYHKYIIDKANLLELMIKDNIMPIKCSDLWPRKIGGVTINAKCKYYCSVSSVCPHYDNGIQPDTVVEW